MLLAFLFVLHIFLLLIYAIAIESKKSRHKYPMLFFASFFPFVGELCLFLTEFGKTDSEFDSSRIYKYRYSKESTKNDTITVLNDYVTRESLLHIIEDHPDNLVETLKKGLDSSDSEVVHLSASAIMKMQRDYELRITSAEREYNAFPENMTLLKAWIVSLMDYYATELLEKELSIDLLKKAEILLKKFLDVAPQDIEGITLLIKVLDFQGNTEAALGLCKKYIVLFSDYHMWKTYLELLIKNGLIADQKQLFSQSTLIIDKWEDQEIKEWKQYERDLANAHE